MEKKITTNFKWFNLDVRDSHKPKVNLLSQRLKKPLTSWHNSVLIENSLNSKFFCLGHVTYQLKSTKWEVSSLRSVRCGMISNKKKIQASSRISFKDAPLTTQLYGYDLHSEEARYHNNMNLTKRMYVFPLFSFIKHLVWELVEKILFWTHNQLIFLRKINIHLYWNLPISIFWHYFKNNIPLCKEPTYYSLCSLISAQLDINGRAFCRRRAGSLAPAWHENTPPPSFSVSASVIKTRCAHLYSSFMLMRKSCPVTHL